MTQRMADARMATCVKPKTTSHGMMRQVSFRASPMMRIMLKKRRPSWTPPEIKIWSWKE